MGETSYAEVMPRLGTGPMSRIVLFRSSEPISNLYLQIMNAIAQRTDGLSEVRRLTRNTHAALIVSTSFLAEKHLVMCQMWRDVVMEDLDDRIPPPPDWDPDQVWHPLEITWDPGDLADSPTESNDGVLARIVAELSQSESLGPSSQSDENVVQSAQVMELPGNESSKIRESDERHSAAALAAEMRGRLAANESDDAVEALRVELVERLEALADERARAVGEVLGSIAMLMAKAEKVRSDLQHTVDTARDLGVSWPDIAGAAGITYQAAQRRWEPEARRKHSEYQRGRSQSRIRDDD